jgi:hypothetical protein
MRPGTETGQPGEVSLRKHVQKAPSLVNIGAGVLQTLNRCRCFPLAGFCPSGMGEHLIGFDCKLEFRIVDRIRPLLCDLRFKLPVEGRVDLARIEIAGEVGQLWSRATHVALHGTRIHDTFPVRIGISRGPDEQFRRSLTGSRHGYGMLP